MSSYTPTPDQIPVNYDQLARWYSGRLARVIRGRCRVRMQPADVEDAVQYILMRFIITDVIAQFRPGFTNARGHLVTFEDFIAYKAQLYCLGINERVGRQGCREPLIADPRVLLEDQDEDMRTEQELVAGRIMLEDILAREAAVS